MDGAQKNQKEFAHRVLIGIGIAIGIIVALLTLWYAAHVLLLLFAGVLLAIALRAPADALARHTPLTPGWSLALIVLALFLVAALTAWLYGPQIVQGMYELLQNIPKALDGIRAYLRQYPWGQTALSLLSEIQWTAVTPELLRRLAGIFSTALPAIASLIVILFLGIYISAEPRTYINGVVRLVPIPKRPRAAEVLQRLGYVLKWFLVGRAASMLILGVFTWAGLALLGVPSALPLAIVAGLLEFIPNIGPVLAAIPAIMVAFSQSPALALWVLLLYVALQTVESYLITPLIQREMISLPPALLFVVQLLMGLFFGILGLLLAAPLAAVLLMLVQMLYVSDVLGDRSQT